MVKHKPLLNNIFRIIRSLDERPTASVTNTYLFRRHPLQMIRSTALITDTPTSNPAEDHLFRRIQIKNNIQGSITLLAKTIQRFSLAQRARKTVAQKALLQDLGREPMLDQTHGNVIRHQLPAGEVLFDLDSQRSSRRYFFTEPLTTGDMLQLKPALEFRGHCSLPRARGTQKHNPPLH